MFSVSVLKRILQDQRIQFGKSSLPTVERTQLWEIPKHLNSPFAVVISGLRRAGKSTFLSQIQQRFYPDGGFFYAHFEDDRLIGFTAQDFDNFLTTQIELFGDQKCFFLDEVQNIPGWELFVRRLVDQHYKVFVTGSNASLLSRELGTRLTGRYIPIELFPLSFEEYSRSWAERGRYVDALHRLSEDEKELSVITKKSTSPQKTFTNLSDALLRKQFDQYLKEGGIPPVVCIPEKFRSVDAVDIHQALYNDILYRDIIGRYKIDSVRELKELSHYLLSNIACPFSYNKLKQLLMLGSVNTVKNFVEYLENSWLFFTLNLYSPSVKRQQIAPKKVYCIDTGLVQNLAFFTGKDRGRLLENVAFLFLRKKYKELFYYKTGKGFEVDFLERKTHLLVQVCSDFTSAEVRERELRALEDAMVELGYKKATIFTETEEEEIQVKTGVISVLPLRSWIL